MSTKINNSILNQTKETQRKDNENSTKIKIRDFCEIFFLVFANIRKVGRENFDKKSLFLYHKILRISKEIVIEFE